MCVWKKMFDKRNRDACVHNLDDSTLKRNEM